MCTCVHVCEHVCETEKDHRHGEMANLWIFIITGTTVPFWSLCLKAQFFRALETSSLWPWRPLLEKGDCRQHQPPTRGNATPPGKQSLPL